MSVAAEARILCQPSGHVSAFWKRDEMTYRDDGAVEIPVFWSISNMMPNCARAVRTFWESSVCGVVEGSWNAVLILAESLWSGSRGGASPVHSALSTLSMN